VDPCVVRAAACDAAQRQGRRAAEHRVAQPVLRGRPGRGLRVGRTAPRSGKRRAAAVRLRVRLGAVEELEQRLRRRDVVPRSQRLPGRTRGRGRCRVRRCRPAGFGRQRGRLRSLVEVGGAERAGVALLPARHFGADGPGGEAVLGQRDHVGLPAWGERKRPPPPRCRGRFGARDPSASDALGDGGPLCSRGGGAPARLRRGHGRARRSDEAKVGLVDGNVVDQVDAALARPEREQRAAVAVARLLERALQGLVHRQSVALAEVEVGD